MPTGAVTAYDLTVGVVVNMDEAIYMLDPMDSPLITGMAADGNAVLGTAPVDEIEFAWMDDGILTPRSRLAGAVTTGDTIITVQSGDRLKFSTGDSVYFAKAGTQAEFARITSYGATTDTLIVSRAIAGTATNYASGDVIMGLGTALPEGSDPELARSRDRVNNTNVTQIFGPTAVHMSRTEQQVRKYGVASEWSRQLYARMQENVISREQAFLYGTRYSSTTTKIRTTGGLDYFITTNVDATSTQLTVLTIQSNQQSAYNVGGMPNILICKPHALADLNDMANATVINTELDEDRRGRRRVTTVMTEFGDVTVVRDRWLNNSDAFLINRENVTRRVIQPLVYEPLAKTGDSDKAQVVCEEGLEVKGEEHMVKFTALSYTGGV